MLVLTRKTNKSILIGDDVEVTIIEVRGEQVRIGINAPKSLPVHRQEVYQEIKEQQQKASETPA